MFSILLYSILMNHYSVPCYPISLYIPMVLYRSVLMTYSLIFYSFLLHSNEELFTSILLLSVSKEVLTGSFSEKEALLDGSAQNLLKVSKLFFFPAVCSIFLTCFVACFCSATFSDCHWNSGDTFEVRSAIILHSL